MFFKRHSSDINKEISEDVNIGETEDNDTNPSCADDEAAPDKERISVWGRIKSFLFGGNRPLLREVCTAVLHFISLLGLDIVFRYIYEQNNTSPLSNTAPFLLSVGWCVLLCGLGVILPRFLRRIYIIITTLFFGVLVVVHAFFSSFFKQYMSFSAVMFADEGGAFFDWSYFTIPKKFIAAVILFIMIAVFAALILPKAKKYLIRGITTVAIAALSILMIVVVKDHYFSQESGGVAWDSIKTPSDHYEDFSDYNMCMHMCGLYHYTFCDIYISTGLNDYVDRIVNSGRVDELDAYYSEKIIDPDNEMTGVLKGKNLLVIQLESIDTWMINDVAMPTLTSVREQSVDFTNYYAPKYLWAATFNSENIVNTGMISPMNSSKLGYFTKTSYPYSLPNLFKEEGYTVNSYHRSSGEIYSRGEIHTNWGYESYNSYGNMGMQEPDMDSSMMDGYDMFCPDDKSFMSFIITYTGHGPYNEETQPAKRHEAVIRERLGEGEYKDEYVYALCHAYETDLFVKALIERMASDGRLDDTAIIFYTDHYDHYLTDAELLAELKGTSDTNLLCHVPCFIYSKELEAQKSEKIVSTYDILPTIVNLFGFDNDGRYYIGNDMFSENGGYVIFSDRSWSDGETYFQIHSSQPTELSKKRSAEIDRRLEACWDTIKYDYFKTKK